MTHGKFSLLQIFAITTVYNIWGDGSIALGTECNQTHIVEGDFMERDLGRRCKRPTSKGSLLSA